MKKYISLFVILSVVFIVGFNSASAKAADISAMEQQLQILMQQLQVLQNQFRQQSGGAIPSAGNETLKIPENSGLNTSIPIVSPSTSTPVIGGGPSNIEYPIQNPGNISWCHAFNTNIGMGATGPEVSALETALNKEGLGNFTESTYDDALASAVSGFQEKYRSDILTPNGLQYGTGYVGPSTRTKLNSLYGCNNSIISPVPVPLPAPIITTTTSNSITISSVSGEYSGVGNLTQGQTAYIKGTGFDASHNYKVEFLDTPVSVNATVNDSNTMTFITPVFGAGSYNYNLRVIDMSVSGSISNSLPVTLLALTTSKSGIIITAVNSVDTNPGIIVQGQTAYILGSGFNQSTNYTVFIGNNDSQQYSITPTVVDSNHMTFIVPSSLPVISSPYVYGLKVGVYNSGLGGYDLSNTLQVTVISASPIATTTQAAPYIHIYGTDGSQTSDSSISANIGDTFTISGVPQNIQGLSYYYGSGYPPSGYYNRAFFFDFGNNNSCGNNTEWTLTCTAKVPGSIAYSVAIYANGQTYMSNKVTVTVNNSSATTTQAAPSVTITSPSAGQTYIAGQTIPITWNSTGDTYGKVNIQLWQYYSTGGRGSSPAVTVSDSGSGAYNWVLPANQPAGTYSVSATLWGQDVTGWTGQFAIAAPASTQSFTVNSITPTSGPVGAPVTINASIPASGNYEIHFGNGGKTVSLSSGTQNINYAIPTGVSGCDFWTSNYACTLPVQAVAPGTYPVYISYTGPNGTNNSSNQVNFTVTASSVATTTQSAPTLSVSLSPTNPPVQDIAMGTTNVVLASYRLTNNNGEAVTVQGIGMIVGGDIRYSSVASNFRLMSGSTVIASGVNPASGQLKWSGINYEIPQGGYVDLNVVADINTWSALQPLGLENSTTNPTVQVALTGVNFIGASSGLNRSLGIQGIPGGSVMQVLRTNLTATPANVNLGSAFSPNELVGAFTFTNIGTDAATPYAQLDGISINLNLANSSASKATTTIRFADASGNILGSYQANIGINTGYALNGLGGAPTIPIGSSLTVYVYADTAINGINVRPVGSNIPIAINTSLTYYNWSDMTRTAIAPNPYPANALPVSGGMATVALNQPSNADELANVLQSIQGVLTELKSFGL